MAKNTKKLRLKKDRQIKRRLERKKMSLLLKGLHPTKTKIKSMKSLKSSVITVDSNIYYLLEENYFELKELEKILSDKYNIYFDIIKRHIKRCRGIEDNSILKVANETYNKLYLVRTYINRFNGYKALSVAYEGEYGVNQNIYTFKNGKKKNVTKWVEKNGLEKSYKSYDIYSDYDCTGSMVSENVEIRGSKVIITKYYDV